MNKPGNTLYYIHDPMCSWCWGFAPVWKRLSESLQDKLNIQPVLGGLAPDSTEPMSQDMQLMLQQVWMRIQSHIPGTRFNFDFWHNNIPVRSTYPACRAVIAATNQDIEYANAMTQAIQNAYYLHARNPSDPNVLEQLATETGCNTSEFVEDLHSERTQQLLMEQIRLTAMLGVSGFPSLVLETVNKKRTAVAVDYLDHSPILEQIERFIAA